MQANTSSINNIGYAGEARIKLLIGNKPVVLRLNNAGTEHLGTLLSIALSGDTNNIQSLKNRVPSKFGFQIEMGMNTGDWRNLLYGVTPVTSGVWGTAVHEASDSIYLNNPLVIGKTQFTALVSNSLVQRNYTVTDNTNLRIMLMNNLNQELAIIQDLGEKERTLPLLYTALINGQDALIEWTLYILNMDKENNK